MLWIPGSRGGEIRIAGGADGGIRECFAFGEAVGDFVADDGAKIGVSILFVIAVADTAKIKVRAIADVALILIGPADKTMVTVFGFHGGFLGRSLVQGLGFGNGFRDLAFLIRLYVIAFRATHGDQSMKRWVFELAMGSLLTVHDETGFAKL